MLFVAVKPASIIVEKFNIYVITQERKSKKMLYFSFLSSLCFCNKNMQASWYYLYRQLSLIYIIQNHHPLSFDDQISAFLLFA
jgi:hypothetical protein